MDVPARAWLSQKKIFKNDFPDAFNLSQNAII
jgi:hypothetical protein